jgi:3-hydroxyisobutyrate dehydrogenase-like beta-hydroxyacid dehydrogenase
MTVNSTLKDVALIGFGEAGGIIGQDLVAQGVRVRAYDRLLQDPLRREAMLTKAANADVEMYDSAAEAVRGVQLVICAVTAGSALAVAKGVADDLLPGQLFMDINSVAPATKQAASDALQACGAGYVDAAVMAPVPPQRLQTPILLGGAQAMTVLQWLEPLGFNVKVVADSIGVASAIKMCRSIMIKGLEALTTECLSTARQYGAEERVLASLHKSFPEMGWNARLPHYLISRVAEHGLRRAEEMEEVAKTAADVGVTPNMSQAIVATQRGLVQRMAGQGLVYAEPFDWRVLVDTLYPEKSPQ